MRAGKLKIKRYKVHHRRWGWLAVIALIGLGGMAWHFYQQGDLPLPLPPAPTLSPEEAAADQRTLTLPAQSWYALQLGVFEQQASAKALAESYQARGAAGFIDTRTQFRVLAAAYESRADAQAVQYQLQAAHQVDAYIIELPSPEITLRITGQKAQLTALSDAYDALHQTALHLSQLSVSLDQGTEGEEVIRAALQSQKNTISALKEKIDRLFGASPHRAVQPIQAILDELAQSLDRALSAQGKTRLGAGVKYCQLLCIVRMAEYAALLAQ